MLAKRTSGLSTLLFRVYNLAGLYCCAAMESEKSGATAEDVGAGTDAADEGTGIFSVLSSVIPILLALAVAVWAYFPSKSDDFLDANTNTSQDGCAICLSPPQDPKTLNCGHTFCRQCIQELRQRAFGGFIEDACPLCRVPLEDCAEKAFMEAVVLLVRSTRLMAMYPDSQTVRELDRKVYVTLERALSMDPNHLGAMVTLGETLSDEDPRRAIQMLQNALNRVQNAETNQSAILLALGRSNKNMNKSEEAIRYYRKALKAAQGEQQSANHNMEAVAHMQIAMLLEQQGDIPGAAKEYEAGMEANPTDAMIPFNLGVTLEEEDTEASIAAYRKALAIDNAFSPANIAVAKGYRARIVAGAHDNSMEAGIQRAENVQYWLGALLRAKQDVLLSPEDKEYCDGEISTIQNLFPKVWAVYQMSGDRAMMAKV